MNACSFCGLNAIDVDRLVAGPAVFICPRCVDLCNEILAEPKQTKIFSEHLRAHRLKQEMIDAALTWFREVTPRTLPQEVSMWNAAKALAAFNASQMNPAQPVCSRCGRKLVRGPIGGGHFDWLECKHAP